MGEVYLADERWPWEYKEAMGMQTHEVTMIFGPHGFVLLVPMPNRGLRVAANFLPPGFDAGISGAPSQSQSQSQGGGHVEGNKPIAEQLQWYLDEYAPTTTWIDGAPSGADTSVRPNTM